MWYNDNREKYSLEEVKSMKDFEEKVFEVLENVCLEYNASKQDIYEALDRFEIMFFELHNVKDENEM